MTLFFYLLRHGESEGNLRTEYIAGQSLDTPLTDLGCRQAAAAGKRWKAHFPCSALELWASPAKRTQQTAQHFCEAAALPFGSVQQAAQIVELSQGDWVGRLRSEVYSGENLQEVNADSWHFAAPNGESQSEVAQRFYAFLRTRIEAARSGQTQARHFLLFSHAIAIKALMREILGFDAAHVFKMQVHNASLSVLQYEPLRGWSLQRLNDFAHLEGLE